MSLKEKLDSFKADFKGGKAPFFAPPEIHPIMERATAELIASDQVRHAVKAGDIAPSFSLVDANGNVVSSLDLLRKGPLIVTFYRGVWCPYCNLELAALQEALPLYLAEGANLLAISPQNQANSRKSARSNNLSFPILTDVQNTVAAEFGLRFKLPPYLVDLYKSLKNDLPSFNGDDSWTLPIPARYVIAPDGIVHYANIDPDYTRRPEPEALLPVLRAARILAQ